MHFQHQRDVGHRLLVKFTPEDHATVSLVAPAACSTGEANVRLVDIEETWATLVVKFPL